MRMILWLKRRKKKKDSIFSFSFFFFSYLQFLQTLSTPLQVVFRVYANRYVLLRGLHNPSKRGNGGNHWFPIYNNILLQKSLDYEIIHSNESCLDLPLIDESHSDFGTIHTKRFVL